MLERSTDAARRSVIFAGMTLVLALWTGVPLGACVGPFSELQEQQYPNADAVKAGDTHRWIPNILPSDSTRIREVHQPDTNQTWGCFTTPHSDEVRRLLNRLHAHKTTGPIGSRPAELFRDFSWWPDSMTARSEVQIR